jgi:putative transposase
VSIPSCSTFRPKLPKYKHKTAGRNLLIYEWGAIWKRELDRGLVVVSGLGELVKTKQTRKTVDQVRLVPKSDHYVVEIVYQREATPAPVDPEFFVVADLGVNVLAALVSNKPGFIPRLVNGRPLKAANQLYNKQCAHLQQQLAKANRFTSSPLDRLTSDAQPPCPAVPAHGQPSHHRAARWRKGSARSSSARMSSGSKGWSWATKTREEFVQIPHAPFIDLLTYKAELVEIKVILTEESYTR